MNEFMNEMNKIEGQYQVLCSSHTSTSNHSSLELRILDIALRTHSSQEFRTVEKEYIGCLARVSVSSVPTSFTKGLADCL